MGKSEFILHGPELPFELFQGSLSEYLISKIKSHPKDNIFQINAGSGEELTFDKILKLSIEIGEGLIKDGLKFGDVVALAGRNSTQLHSSALGVLFSGGVFASVEPEMRIFEMQLLYEQVQPKYVFCEHQIESDVEECLKNMKSNAKIVIIDAPASYKTKNLRFEDLLVEVDVETYAPRPIPNPSEDIALIVCSSGSSGIPKGVKISHRGMVFQLQSWEYTVTPVDFTRTFFQTSHFFWISGIIFIFMSAVFGQKRIYIREINETNMLKAIDKYKPYFTMIPPAEILALLNFSDLKKYDLSSIEYIFTGGSSLPQTVIDRLGEFSDHVKLFQGYGMTELSGVVTIFNTDAKYIRSVGTLHYGVSLKCADISTGESLGPNSVGEFLFKSVSIMKGYIGNEEATKAAIDEDGWYHSGDLGYYDEDGRLYIVDRIKEVIKFRNLQISPAEVEAFVESIPGVKEAAVMGIPNEKDTYHPMALVVRKKGSSVTAEDIMEAVKNNLSSYKQLRAGVFFVDSLPRTGTGKIKRVQLKELGKKLYNESRNIV